MKRVMMCALGAIIFFTMQISAQIYPDTLWVPVTYYDFHSNTSNPEFQCDPYNSGVHTGMVMNTLDADRKPVATNVLSRLQRNAYVKYWFRDWNTAVRGRDYTIPVYSGSGGSNTFTGTTTVTYDTAFKNIVIRDSLLFRYVANSAGVYQYVNSSFFPLDSRGFGRETRSHNYSFSMELHWTFTKQPGLTFRFTGDDDVWAFIDNQLRMDIGGIHGASSDSFFVDDIPGLVNGREYSFDFFFAERHTNSSSIRITTNIISIPPTSLSLRAEPDGDMCAGDTLRLLATVLDDTGGVRPEIGDRTTWRFIRSGGNAPSTLFPQIGDTVRFSPTEAWDTVVIEGVVQEGTIILRDTLKVFVVGCYPDHLVIEGTPPPYTGSALRNDNPLTELRIPSDRQSANAYAILRDKFGNFVQASQLTAWSITQGAGTIIDRVTNGVSTIGEGITFKEGPSGRGEIAAQSQQHTTIAFKDVVPVIVDAVSYDSLRIVVNNNGTFSRISNLIINTEACSLLIVQGRRTDGLGWESVPGNWASTIRATINAPTASQTWNFCPSDTGRGRISTTFNGRTAEITVQVLPGGPFSINLFPSNTSSTPYIQPPAFLDSIIAGRSVPIFARIFDINGVRLTRYDVITAPVAWSIQEINGYPPFPTGTLQGPGGNQNVLIPTRAPNIVQVKATFNENGRIFADSVRFRIIPDSAHHITIQADTATTVNWADITQIEFGPSDTSRLLYPVIRDRFNNYIRMAELARWSSRDTTVATANATEQIFLGEGIVIRQGDGTVSTYIYAVSSTTPAIRDSVRVSLSAINYDSLQIYVLESTGQRPVDTIRVRTDESQMLYARGKRSDGRGWDDIPVTWSTSNGLPVTGTPPGFSQNWNVIPTAIATGKIFITRAGSVSDSVTAIFLAGLPGAMSIYKGIGNPATVPQFPRPPIVDTVIAGTTNAIVAKIFDRNLVWLPQYENNTVSAPLISWQITRISGNAPTDTLDRRTGASITFSPKKAYQTYLITANFVEGTRQLTASINIYVKYGPAHHLVIEGSPSPSGSALNYDTPIPNGLSFGTRDSVQFAYAILRDANQNYVERSQSTNWQSVNELLIRATEATATLGQGRVQRLGAIGETQVIAWNRNNPSLRDTVLVHITDFSYDSLKIVVNDSVRITEIVMRSDQDTTVMVIGLRSYDQQWVPVPGNWAYQSTNINLNLQSQQRWEFAPGDTTHGLMIVTNSNSVPDTVRVNIVPGLADKLVLFPKRGPESAINLRYPGIPDTITVVAGQHFPLVSKIFDHMNVLLRDYESSPLNYQIRWSYVELAGNDPTGLLSATQGDSISFFPKRAFQRVYVIGTLTANNLTFADTVLLSVVAGEPRNLFIEASANWQTSRTRPNPVDTITILGNATSGFGYAILRDSLGNFSRYSTVTTWGVVNNDTAVSVRNGTTAIGEGIITRNVREAIVKIHATDVNGFKDSTVVRLVKYFYTQLRILVENDPTRDSLVMPTTSDTTLYVQGLRSDTTLWEYTDNAIWGNSPSLQMIPTAPTGRMWRFSPTDTGTGIIRVTLNNDSVTKPDTLQVRFIPGPPSEIRIKIITPEQQRFAGKPILMEIELLNEDGRVKGPYDFQSVKYDDILPDGGRPRPFVLLGKDTLFLDSLGKEHFNNGIDTIPLVLFYAPWNYRDSLHQIIVTMDGLKATTERFRLYPDDLSKLVLEKYENVVSPIGDTIIIRTTDPPVQIISIGYDKFGNRIGAIPSDWKNDSTLHQIPGITTKVPNIYYDGINVKDNEIGRIITNPSDSAHSKITTNVVVRIIAPPIKLKIATTGDFDGDGYLDHFILKFDRPVTLPAGFPVDLRIAYNNIIFKVDEDSIRLNPSRTDSVWIIAVPEEIGDSTLQTGWRPIINAGVHLNIGIDSILNHVTIDGAGPVIEKVTKIIKEINNRKTDEVTVVFSEPIQRFDYQLVSVTDTPKVFLYVWEKDPNDSTKLRLLDSMLVGINNFTRIDGKTSFTFTTTNGANINQQHFFSIRSIITSGGRDTVSFITDTTELLSNKSQPNVPNPNNRQVQVVVLGNPQAEIITFPNPASATARRVDAGLFYATHEQDARNWILQDNAGVIFNVAFMIPTERDVKIKCEAKVYDVVGNLVTSNIQANIREALEKSGQKPGVGEMDIYWNGIKPNSMKAAPGVYKIIVYIDYYGSPSADKYSDARRIGVLGMRHANVR